MSRARGPARPQRATTAATYEVRTYGCQMNVHDSERLSGLLEEAGYVRRGATGATRRRRRASTPARCGRTPTTGSTATSATCARSRTRTPACRSRSAAAWRRRTAARSCAARPGSTSCSAPTTSARCRCCWSGPGTTRGRRWRSSSRSRSSRRRCRPGASRRTRLGVDLGRLQQHLHVLHRPVAARQGEGPPARRRPGRGRGAGRRRRARGDPARPERQLLRRRVRRPARVRQAAARLRRDRRAGAGPVHLAAPDGLHRRRDRRDGRDPDGLPPAAHAAAVRLGRGAARRCAAPTGGDRYLGDPRPRCAPRCRTPRSPPTSSSASPARPRPTSSRPSTSSGRRGSPARSPSSTRRGPARRPPAWPTRCRKRGRAGAVRAAGRAAGRDLAGRRTGRWSARRSRCWSPTARAARTRATGRLSGRARDGRLVHFAAGATTERPARRRRRPPRSPTRAPHHLVADGPLLSHRRTRAGDAHEAGRPPDHPGRPARHADGPQSVILSPGVATVAA